MRPLYIPVSRQPKYLQKHAELKKMREALAGSRVTTSTGGYGEGFRSPAPTRETGPSRRGRRPKASLGGNRGTEGLRLPRCWLWGFKSAGQCVTASFTSAGAGI